MTPSKKVTGPDWVRVEGEEEMARKAKFQALQAPLPQEAIEWRVDGKPREFDRSGKKVPFARFVAYVKAQYVQERLDEWFMGDWNTELTLLQRNGDGGSWIDKQAVETYVYKCSLTVSGLTREDVGEGDTHKAAATDAFKRAAVRFGIARELYEMGQNWVPVTSLTNAKPTTDPGAYYAARARAQVAKAKPTASTILNNSQADNKRDDEENSSGHYDDAE